MGLELELHAICLLTNQFLFTEVLQPGFDKREHVSFIDYSSLNGTKQLTGRYLNG